jgi:hypothetical protein
MFHLPPSVDISYSGEDADGGLLDCGAVRTGRWVPTFWKIILPPFSGLKCPEGEDSMFL